VGLLLTMICLTTAIAWDYNRALLGNTSIVPASVWYDLFNPLEAQGAVDNWKNSRCDDLGKSYLRLLEVAQQVFSDPVLTADRDLLSGRTSLVLNGGQLITGLAVECSRGTTIKDALPRELTPSNLGRPVISAKARDWSWDTFENCSRLLEYRWRRFSALYNLRMLSHNTQLRAQCTSTLDIFFSPGLRASQIRFR
jgi:hypothetical protein